MTSTLKRHSRPEFDDVRPDAPTADASAGFVDLLEAVLACEPLEQVLDRVMQRTMASIPPTSRGLILVKDAQSKSGWSANAMASGEQFARFLSLDKDDGTPLSQVIDSGEENINLDLHTAEFTKAHVLCAKAMGFRHVTCVPIRHCNSQVVVGAVAVYQGSGCSAEVAVQAARAAARCAASLQQVGSAVQRADKATSELSTLASTIPGVVYQRRVKLNGEIRYTYISESAYELFGVTAETILTDPEALFKHYGPDYRKTFRDRLIKASRNLELWDVEATIMRPDGQTRYTHAIARPTAEPVEIKTQHSR